MNSRQVIQQITSVGKQVLPKDACMWLYGSRARNEAHASSDWDVLILLNKDKIESSDYDSYAFPLNQLGWTTNETISPVLYTMDEWRNSAATLFYHNVQHDKIELV